MERSVLVAIPAFNEEKNIASTIEKTSPYGKVFVFNNNSTDQTKYIALSLDCNVVDVEEIGYEEVVYSIADYFISSHFQKLVIIDGDGEVGIDSIKEALIKLEDYDSVIGYRNNIKRIGEKIVCILFKSFFSINDIYCGFKCFKKGGLSLNKTKNTFATALVNKRSSIFNIPVTVYPRPDKSKLGHGFYLNAKLLIFGIRGFLN